MEQLSCGTHYLHIRFFPFIQRGSFSYSASYSASASSYSTAQHSSLSLCVVHRRVLVCYGSQTLVHKGVMADLGLGLRLRASFLPKSCFTGLPLIKSSFFRIPSSVVTCMNNPPKSYLKSGKKEHHLWMKRDSAGSGQKALHLVRIVSKLPNEKEAIYGALDKWTAWETEFPVIAAAKALEILRRRNQWLRIIQVCKWLLSKGQVLTMGTYDSLLLAFERDGRVDEAEELWNMILQRHTRSVSKRLFSRMIALYDHHHFPEKVLEVFADMEELGVRPDADTVKRVVLAFGKLGESEKQKLLLIKYQKKWKYLHFNGERVRIQAE